MDSDSNSWAQLVSLTDMETLPIQIAKSKFVIGRNEDCDLSHNGNKLVSSKHCFLEKDDDGKVWLYDTSTNGTLLNLKNKLTKGNRLEICHGDEIYIVYKKNAQEENIGYIFQDKACLEKESEDTSTEDYDYGADNTLSDDAINMLDESICNKSEEKTSTKRKVQSDEKEQPLKKKKVADEDNEEKRKDTSKPAKPDTHEDTPSTSKAKTDVEEDDDMLSTLTCIICQEILHDCISLQPCMHSFCSGCYSEWMERSNECPSCRMKVDRINKNHLVNNLVEAYLKARPDKKRPEEDIKELDWKNKITRDMLYSESNIKSKADEIFGPSDDDDDDDEHNDDDDDNVSSDDDDDDNNDDQPPTVTNVWNNAAFYQPYRPAPTVCRQCPNYAGAAAIPPTTTADPDDEDAKTYPPVPNYQCRPGQNHILCMCCLQPMPDRAREFRQGGNIPPQQCTFCFRSFCHAYWGCQIANCTSCIGKLKDLNFGQNCLKSLILDNAYESSVLRDYLANQDKSVKSVLADCLAKMVTGSYKCNDQARLSNGINTPLCYSCGLRIFKDLAYQYRQDIPKQDLPDTVTRRSDCHWGKNCRTQRHNQDHARRFNHICEQTRTV